MSQRTPPLIPSLLSCIHESGSGVSLLTAPRHLPSRQEMPLKQSKRVSAVKEHWAGRLQGSCDFMELPLVSRFGRWSEFRYRRTSISGTTFSGKKCLSGTIFHAIDLTFPCYLTTFGGKKCISGKVICAFFVPLIEVLLYQLRERPFI
jgi:hypothetical protein